MLVSTPNYGGFVEDSDPYYLGVAKDSAKVNWLNKEDVNFLADMSVNGEGGG